MMQPKPRLPPFTVGTRLRCLEGHDAYVPCVERPRDLKTNPEDWTRISGVGLEVVIDHVKFGYKGTGKQLVDEDGPIVDDTGEPYLDVTKDGYSVYYVVRGTGTAVKMSGRCIFPDSKHKWLELT